MLSKQLDEVAVLLEKLTVAELGKNFPAFKVPISPLRYTQKLASERHCETAEFSSHSQNLLL